MKESKVMPGAEPFFFEGNETGVLLSHGFTGTTQSMHFIGEALNRDGGFTTMGVRLRGHGTRPEEMARASAEEWICDLETALGTLHRRCKRVFIGGLSMGGTLTLYMAAMHPEVICGAMPVNAAIFLNNPDMAGLALRAGAPASVPGVGADIKKPGQIELVYPVVPVPAIRQLYALMAVTEDLLPRVVCPALIFTSTEDHVVPPANGPFIMERLGSQDKRLVWLENSYHVATLDNEKERIAEEMVAFIDAH
jgi:carboxylesterase